MSKGNKSNELAATTPQTAAIVASIALAGDLSRLTDEQLVQYYNYECTRLGLDPLSRPFDLLRLQGKLTLYANRRCADQLAAKHNATRTLVEDPTVKDFAGTKLVYCKARVRLPNGREEEDIATLPNTDLVNQLMKAATKACRRATLKVVGWGGIDETEIDTIPRDQVERVGSLDSYMEKRRGPAAEQDRVTLAPSSRPAEPPPVDVQHEDVKPAPAATEEAPATPPAKQAPAPRKPAAEKRTTESKPAAETPAAATTPAAPSEADKVLAALKVDLRAADEPEKVARTWLQHRAAVQPLGAADRDAAWQLVVACYVELRPQQQNARWQLKQIVAALETKDAEAAAEAAYTAPYREAIEKAQSAQELHDVWTQEVVNTGDQALVDRLAGARCLRASALARTLEALEQATALVGKLPEGEGRTAAQAALEKRRAELGPPPDGDGAPAGVAGSTSARARSKSAPKNASASLARAVRDDGPEATAAGLRAHLLKHHTPFAVGSSWAKYRERFQGMRAEARGIVIDRMLAVGADEMNVTAALDGIVAHYEEEKAERARLEAERAAAFTNVPALPRAS